MNWRAQEESSVVFGETSVKHRSEHRSVYSG